jgi:hypothetical protein
MELQLVNRSPEHVPAALISPRAFGYIHIGAEVSPPQRPGPIVLRGRAKAELVERLQRLARRLEHEGAVVKATVYEAVLFPPFDRLPYVSERGRDIELPRFDVVILVETTSPEAIPDVQATGSYRALLDELAGQARRVCVIAARNAKRIDDVDKSRQGLFLFNYFVAEDARVALELWDHLARWFEVEAGLDNSTLLVPLEGETTGYVAINHARWDKTLPGLSRHFLKKSFRTFVLENFARNHVGPMPVLYRLARPRRRAAAMGIPVLLGAAASAAFATYFLAGIRRGRGRAVWRRG